MTTTNTISTIFDSLPTGKDPASLAIRSVHGRGFYDNVLPITAHQHAIGQALRLFEECGEYDDELHFGADGFLSQPNMERIASELADVYIVLAQLAWLTGMDTGALWGTQSRYTDHTLTGHAGDLCRALRKFDGDYGEVHIAIRHMAEHLKLLSIIRLVDLGAIITEKLAADELRGYQHSGQHVERRFNGTPKPQPTPDNPGHVWRDLG